ncbi:hypothetical protein JHK85_041121 [Glycine max]|nr:hypothetical protein JHK85_041121 [Glycine max]
MSPTTIHENNHHNNSHIPKNPKLSSTIITPSKIDSEFGHHDVAVAHINNGDFRCCPASILSTQHRWQLHGEIPSSLSNLQHLTYLDISYNNFGGEISDLFDKLSKLEALYVSENNLVTYYVEQIKAIQ